jgi:hypothetical protein
MSVRKTIFAGIKVRIGEEIATVKHRQGLQLHLEFADGRVEVWGYKKTMKYGAIL